MGSGSALKDNDRIGVIGAGPAGTFFAIHIDNLAKKQNRKFNITLFDRKVFDMFGPGGCNMCAGAIGYITYDKIRDAGIDLQDTAVRRIVDGYVIHGKRRKAHIVHPERKGIYTVFRGGGPLLEKESRYRSFDQVLLDQCLDRGMVFINERVKDVEIVGEGEGRTFRVHTLGGKKEEFNLIVGAFGVNSPISNYLMPEYIPPKTWHTCQAEVKVDPGYIPRVLGNMIHIFSTEDSRIRFIAVTPKDEFLTITAIGEYVKIAYLKEELENNKRLKTFLPENYELICHCHPQAPVGCAINCFDDGVAVIGDAFVSRFLKNGIESAYETSKILADTVVNYGKGKDDLEKHFFRRCLDAYHADNRWGKMLFEMYERILRRGVLSDIYIGCVQKEGEDASEESARLTRILWGVFAGDQPYREIVQEAFTFSTFYSLAKNSLFS